MKEVKLPKRFVFRIGAILFALLILFIVIWLGFSFISMRNENPYVAIAINLEDNDLAKKVRNDFPKKDNNYIIHQFPIILEEYTNTEEEYIITGVPYNFDLYYENREDSRFTLALDRHKGEYDFSKLEFNEPLIISLSYRVERDLRYFTDFSFCVLKRAYSNLFDLNNPCSRGNCIVERELTKWEVELMDKGTEEKVSYYNSFEKKSLKRGLFNYYITNDFGYFDSSSFKLRTTQVSMPDKTYKMGTTFVNQKVESSDSSTIQWMLAGISEFINKEYTEYADIDLMSYMDTINSYSNEAIRQTLNDCQMAFETVDNLKDCSNSVCNDIKTSSFGHCKRVLEYELLDYDSKVRDYHGYDTTGSGNGYLLYLPSEMIYYNNIVDLLGLSAQKYTQNQIYRFYSNAENMANAYPTVIGNCNLLKTSEDMKSEFKDSSLTDKIEKIYESLPDFSSLCDDILKDEFCSLSIAKKLTCADATLSSYPEVSKSILYDTFYRHYFLSTISSKLNSYEVYRENKLVNGNTKNLQKLDEYGYFVWRYENRGTDGVTVTSFADMLDSYYFIYLMNRINED